MVAQQITIDGQRFAFFQDDDGNWTTDIDPAVPSTLRRIEVGEFDDSTEMERRVEAILWGLNHRLFDITELKPINKALSSLSKRLRECPVELQFPVFAMSIHMRSVRSDRYLVSRFSRHLIKTPENGLDHLTKLGEAIYDRYYVGQRMEAISAAVRLVSKTLMEHEMNLVDPTMGERCSLFVLALHYTPEVMWRDRLPGMTDEVLDSMGLLGHSEPLEPCSDDNCEQRHQNLYMLYSLWLDCLAKMNGDYGIYNRGGLGSLTNYLNSITARSLADKFDTEKTAVCRMFDWLPPEMFHGWEAKYVHYGWGARINTSVYDGPKNIPGYICLLCRRVLEEACMPAEVLMENEDCTAYYCPIHAPQAEAAMSNRGIAHIRVNEDGPMDELPLHVYSEWSAAGYKGKWNIVYDPSIAGNVPSASPILNLVVEGVGNARVNATIRNAPGNVWLVGACDGLARQNGVGPGHAIHVGNSGNAFRSVSKTLEEGLACGHAIRLGDGNGDATQQRPRTYSSKIAVLGSAYRGGNGSGSARIESKACLGFAVRDGNGKGDAIAILKEDRRSLRNDHPPRFIRRRGAVRLGTGPGGASVELHGELDETSGLVAHRSKDGTGAARALFKEHDQAMTELRSEEVLDDIPAVWRFRPVDS